jgi:DNA anti-recombination protein RmuC
MKQAEDMGVMLEAHMTVLQPILKSCSFKKKELEVDNLKVLLEEQTVEVEKTNAKMTRRIRDSGQQCVTLNEEIRQIQEEIQSLCEK